MMNYSPNTSRCSCAGACSRGLLFSQSLARLSDSKRISRSLASNCLLDLSIIVNVLFQVWHFSLSTEDLALMDKLDKSEENQNTMAGGLREHDPDFY